MSAGRAPERAIRWLTELIAAGVRAELRQAAARRRLEPLALVQQLAAYQTPRH